MASTVAVLLPNLNHARFLPAALGGLVAQTRAPDEVIVVDDGSSDESVAVIESFADRLPGFRFVRNADPGGVNRATNRALSLARSSHVVCTAADDQLGPRFIERMSDAADRYPDMPLCVSQYVEFDDATNRLVRHDNDSELGCWFAPNGPRSFSAAETAALFDRGFPWLPLNAALVRRDALLSLGGFDPGLKWHADWFAVYTLALRQGFAVVPEPLSIFRRTSASFSGVGMRNPREQRAVCLAIYDKLASPAYRDIYALAKSHPAVMSSFVRPLLSGLIARPDAWPFWSSLLAWWLGEVRRGRRPGFLRDFVSAQKRRANQAGPSRSRGTE